MFQRLLLPFRNWLYWKFEPHGLRETLRRKLMQTYCSHPTWSGFSIAGYASRAECDRCHKVVVS